MIFACFLGSSFDESTMIHVEIGDYHTVVWYVRNVGDDNSRGKKGLA